MGIYKKSCNNVTGMKWINKNKINKIGDTTQSEKHPVITLSSLFWIVYNTTRNLRFLSSFLYAYKWNSNKNNASKILLEM